MRKILLFLAAFVATNCLALEGLVVGVSDGDTITVLDAEKTQHKIRLAGIDSPEKAQAFGNRAKEHLSSLVYRKRVGIDGDKVDRYGRRVGKVILDGCDVCLEMVESGFAWHYVKYAREQSRADRALYAAAERDARASKRGLWRDSDPVAPWDWRKAKRGGE